MRKALIVVLLVLSATATAQAQRLSPARQLAYDSFKQLIEINTTDSVGNCTEAAEAMAARLKAAGFAAEDIKVLGPHPRKGNLVVRYRGTSARKPILLRAHLDVVEAGIPMYGTSGIFGDIDDSRAHGRDERIAVQSFFDGQEYLYRLVKAFASPAPKQSVRK
jgi:acetylornithine deacetylase/succinyl-diaminopimelate desuccinylase-like protein